MTSNKSSSQPAIPAPIDFFINYPLYEVFEFTNDSADAVNDIHNVIGKFDTYCPGCRKESTFNFDNNGFARFDESITFRFFKSATCARNPEKHTLSFLVWIDNGTIQKIGQIPSLADLNLADAKQYSKILPPEMFKEFTKAIGLAAHGVGIGSFVYLRRIFESLIEKARTEAAKEKNWNQAEYMAKRMAERIEHLRTHLPEFLVETRALYSILSSGIHELSENECLKAFPAVKVGIELILDEELIKKQRLDKIAAAKKSIASIQQEIAK